MPKKSQGITLLFVSAISAFAQDASTTQPSASRLTATAPATQSSTAPPERFMSDEEFLKIGREFDLDAFIKGLNSPTVDEIIKSLEPIPTREQILDELNEPERQPKLPTLPDNIVEQVDELERRIEKLRRKGALGDDAKAQERALDKAILLAALVVELREDAGQPTNWDELVDARKRVATLNRVRTSSVADRKQLAAADARDPEHEQLYANGQHKEATAIVLSQTAIWRRFFPDDHPLVATGIGHLATLLGDRGALAEAEALHREALAMKQRLFPGDHPDTANSLNNLALLLNDLGLLVEAEALHRESLAMRQRLFPGNHLNVTTSLNNLAIVLLYRGALADSEALFRYTLARIQRHFPGDESRVATTTDNLAMVLRDRGALIEAEALHRESLAMTQRLFPGGHPSVATGLDNLASILSARGAMAEAETLHREALAMRQRFFQADHRSVAASLNNLACIVDARGAMEEAEALYRSALRMNQQLFPGDHPFVARALNNLATLLGDRGALAEAEALHRDALEMRQRIAPGDHPGVAISMNNLAMVLLGRGALVEAEPLLRDTLAMRQRLYAGDHFKVANSLNNLAGCLTERGALEQAEPLARVAFEMTERLRTQIVGGEQERAAFAAVLGLSRRAHTYATILALLNRDGEVLGVLEHGRARAALDLLERSGHDLAAEARELGTADRAQPIAQVQAAEEQARIDLNSTEALLAGQHKERAAWEKMTDKPAADRTQKLSDYEQQITALVAEVKQKRHALTMAGGAVLNELRGLFPAAKALTTEEILQDLAPDEAVISFSWDKNSVLVAFAFGDTTGAEIVAENKEAVKRLDELADRVRSAIARKPEADTHMDPAMMHELAAVLLPEPVRSAVSSARRLVVLPDGPLNGIPLDILVEAEPHAVLPGKSIVYAPSATIYLDRVKHARALREQTGPYAALVLGGAIFDHGHKEPADPKQGVLLVKVEEGSNAWIAGLRRGDVLQKYAKRILAIRNELRPAIRAVNAEVERGERLADQRNVPVELWRKGQVIELALAPGRMGVTSSPAPPAEGLRSMRLLDQLNRGGGEFAANANALDQVRLFGKKLWPLPGTRKEAETIAALFKQVADKAPGSGDGDARARVDIRLLLGKHATLPNLTQQAPGVRYLHLATHGLMGSAARPYDASLALTQPKEPTPDDIGFLTLDHLLRNWGGRLKGCELVVLSACDSAVGAGAAGDEHVSSTFKGAKVNVGTVIHKVKDGKQTLTWSDDFQIPDTPDPHWQVVDSKGNVHLLQELKSKGDKLNRTITLPIQIPDVAKVQIWCSRTKALLGEASYATPVTQHSERVGDSTMSLPMGFFFAGTPTVVASLWKADDEATALLMTRFYENLLGTRVVTSPEIDRRLTPMPKAAALRDAKQWVRSLRGERAKDAVRRLRGGRSKQGAEERKWDYSHPFYWAGFVLIGDPE